MANPYRPEISREESKAIITVLEIGLSKPNDAITPEIAAQVLRFMKKITDREQLAQFLDKFEQTEQTEQTGELSEESAKRLDAYIAQVEQRGEQNA